MSRMFQDVQKVGLHLITRLYHVPVFCSQEDDNGGDDDDWGGDGGDDDDWRGSGGGFGDWSPRSSVSTLTHYIHNNW